jgi:hypothetical protein
MYDLALLALKFSILLSPLFFGYFNPALLTNRQSLAVFLDIQFYVFAFAIVIPGIFAMFHFFSSELTFWCFIAFKLVAETAV